MVNCNSEKRDIHTDSDQVMIGACWSRSMMVLAVHRTLTEIVTGKQRTTSSMTQDQSVDREDYEKFLFFVIASIYNVTTSSALPSSPPALALAI
jgi:hypothetical protein